MAGRRREHQTAVNAEASLELSIVMPCLNEARTVGVCVQKASCFLREHHVAGEIIVADNGSTDGSAEVAARAGARVVPATNRGYGNALQAGITAARGRFVIMGDADDSYDFTSLGPFLDRLRAGCDLVQGCRLPIGGGTIMPSAMPRLHSWLGNPLLSFLARTMFDTQVHDIYCGLRGFRRESFSQLDMRCTGMEFAPEMIVKARLRGARVEEVAVTLYQDGRPDHRSHLRTWRDGWRTLRFLLVYSPRWLFLYPGLLLAGLGLIGYGVALPGITLAGLAFDAHTLLFASLAILLGCQSVWFAVFAKAFAASEGLLPRSRALEAVLSVASLERGLAAGGLVFGAGLFLLLAAVSQWEAAHFGRLDYSYTMRWVIPGVTLTALGFQTILGSFFISILGLSRR